jgi:molybdopterin-guanine dinucleotide biosynthesis protein A
MSGSGRYGDLTAAILAGGLARRFGGRDKARLIVGGRPILERLVEAAAPVASRVILVTNDPARYADAGVPVLQDEISGAGPLGGLITALRASATRRVLALASDLPYVDADFLAYLAGRAPGADLVVPRTPDGLHPLCAVYARALLPVLEAHLASGRRALVDLVGGVRTVEVGPEEVARFDALGRLLTNVNTPDDYEAALSRLP